MFRVARVMSLGIGLWICAGCVAPPAPAPTACGLPVAAPVAEGFDPPAEPWLPGNRGLTFATFPGAPVRAVQDGIVSFAGPVARQWYVTVELDDGSDVTYSYLSSVTVAAGTSVAVGELIGYTGPTPFQLGHRDASGYLDPTPLLAAACGWNHAVLVPVPG